LIIEYHSSRRSEQIFNDEVDAYQSWTLFLIFASILILVSGVVLLTHKKPEPVSATPTTTLSQPPPGGKRKRRKTKSGQEDGEQDVLWTVGDDSGDEDAQELGAVEYGDGDEDVDHHQNPIELRYKHRGVLGKGGVVQDVAKGKGKGAVRKGEGEEAVGLMGPDGDGDEDGDEEQVMDRYQHRPGVHGHGSRSVSSSGSSSHLTLNEPFKDDVGPEAFGDWEGGGKENGRR
jgi:magnesium transporter